MIGHPASGRRFWPSESDGPPPRRVPDLPHHRRRPCRPLPPRRDRGPLGHHRAVLRRTHALGLDELGYLSLPGEAASARLQVVSRRYLTTSIVLTINRGVAGWGEILGDTTVAAAMLDRLLHRSVVLNLDGGFYRLRDHHARNEALRSTATGTRRPLP
ncbi:ATP-binding protein [Mumia sp. DW29H23]|uniref:ATP-binding protein n=1 Tax=Mumia sp. DW29H23 TaxID=3421241 RepID=UPI003D68655D